VGIEEASIVAAAIVLLREFVVVLSLRLEKRRRWRLACGCGVDDDDERAVALTTRMGEWAVWQVNQSDNKEPNKLARRSTTGLS
jgi:hypothetical protein